MEARDTGQSRVPLPPHMMKGVTSTVLELMLISTETLFASWLLANAIGPGADSWPGTLEPPS